MVPYFSSRQLSGENDMWLFPGKGPSQRLWDGNGIFNKWPGKLLIIVPFLGLQFLCPESLSNHLRLLEWKQKYWNCVHCCMLFCLEHLLSIYHYATLLTLLGLLLWVLLCVCNLSWASWSNAKKVAAVCNLSYVVIVLFISSALTCVYISDNLTNNVHLCRT